MKAQTILNQKENEFQQNHSFKPSINQKYKSKQPREVSRDERIKKLQQPNTDKLLKRDQLRAQKEIEALQKNCTFKPQLNSDSN